MLQKTKYSAEIIIIDDGSTDGTAETVLKLARTYKFLKLAKHRKNLGKTAALVTGFRISSGERICIFDADMQFDPWDLPRMMEKMDKGYDIVTGKKVGKYQKPLVSGIYNKMCRMLFKVPVSDLNSIKLFKREVMQGLPLRDDWHRYMVVLALHEGYRVGEVDVKLLPRLHGTSKYTGIWRIFIGFFDLLAVWFQLTFMKKPMLFFGTMGFFTILVALITGVIAIILRVEGNGGDRLLILTILLGLSGIMSFVLGALGEMIATLREKMDFHFLLANSLKGNESISFRDESESPEKSERPEIVRPDRPDHFERRDRPERPERQERPDRQVRPAPAVDLQTSLRSERPERSERFDKPNRPEKSDRPAFEKPERPAPAEKPAYEKAAEKADRPERQPKQDRSDRPEKPARNEFADRNEKAIRPERQDRPEKSNKISTEDRQPEVVPDEVRRDESRQETLVIPAEEFRPREHGNRNRRDRNRPVRETRELKEAGLSGSEEHLAAEPKPETEPAPRRGIEPPPVVEIAFRPKETRQQEPTPHKEITLQEEIEHVRSLVESELESVPTLEYQKEVSFENDNLSAALPRFSVGDVEVPAEIIRQIETPEEIIHPAMNKQPQAEKELPPAEEAFVSLPAEPEAEPQKALAEVQTKAETTSDNQPPVELKYGRGLRKSRGR